jgi:hypothetical protein
LEQPGSHVGIKNKVESFLTLYLKINAGGMGCFKHENEILKRMRGKKITEV